MAAIINETKKENVTVLLSSFMDVGFNELWLKKLENRSIWSMAKLRSVFSMEEWILNPTENNIKKSYLKCSSFFCHCDWTILADLLLM
jgi:hypothetical protein